MTLAAGLRALLAGRLGLDLPADRLAGLAAGRWGSAGVLERLAALPEDSLEWRGLIAEATISETYFFRDPGGFESLERHVLPPLLEARRTGGAPTLRVWSAGCATGEEPYSLAIVLDRILPDLDRWDLELVATDVNRQALERARGGRYRRWALRETPPALREWYFAAGPGGWWRLDERIRRMVAFRPFNLASEREAPVSGPVDLIVCRNALMYLTVEARQRALRRFQGVLAADGLLMVAAAEASAELLSPLVPVTLGETIFFRHPAPPSPVAAVTPHAAASVPVGTDRGGSPSSGQRLPRRAVGDRCRTVAEPVAERVRRARRLADQGQLEEARQACETILTEDRCHLEASVLLAAVHDARGDGRAALTALRRTLYIDPDSAMAHFLLGSLLSRRGELEPARRALDAVVRILSSTPPDAPVPGTDGLSAAALLEMTADFLAATQER